MRAQGSARRQERDAMAFLGAKSAGKCPGVAVGAVLILRPHVGATHEVDRARRRDDDEWSPVGAMMLDGRPSARLRLIIARRRECNWILPVGARRRDDDERSPVGAMMMDGRPSARLRLIIARRREDDDEPVGAMNNINNLPVGAMMIEQRPSAR